MPSLIKNSYQDNICILEPVEDFTLFNGFSCGDNDLDDFIMTDALPHSEQLLAVTYAFRLVKGTQVSAPVAYASLLNDSIRHMTTSRKKKLFPQRKRYDEFPAVKVGRLAVAQDFTGLKIGTRLLTVLKHVFTTQSRTGCRFMTVDAYKDAIGFYEKNDFNFVRPNNHANTSSTVSMYFDLLRFKRQYDS